eukprot:COSAG02_NODE_90_length_37755_cov_29.833364_34_plen_66_part_00
MAHELVQTKEAVAQECRYQIMLTVPSITESYVLVTNDHVCSQMLESDFSSSWCPLSFERFGERGD